MQHIFKRTEICVFKVELDMLQTLTQNEIILMNYEIWAKTEIGEWVIENKINIYPKDQYKSWDTLMTVIPFFIKINSRQYQEYKEILIQNALST